MGGQCSFKRARKKEKKKGKKEKEEEEKKNIRDYIYHSPATLKDSILKWPSGIEARAR